METLRIFDNLKLNDLSQEWVTSIWMEEFLHFSDPPDEYTLFMESEDMGCILNEICRVMKRCMDNNKINEDSSEEFSWQTLMLSNVNSRSLLAVLSYIINNGQQIGVEEDTRQLCLWGTSLYFILLAIPGSNVYKIFHPNLFQLSMNTFQLVEHLTPVYKKSVKAHDLIDLYNNDVVESQEKLQHSEKVTLIKGLNNVMFKLISMLQTFFMRDHVNSVNFMIQSLIKVAKLETNVNHFRINKKSNEASLSSLSYNAYVALQELCDSKHGHVEVTIRIIAKYMLPYLLANYIELPQKALNIVRETMVHFLKDILHSHKEKAEYGFQILVQHLMVKCPERLETRQKQAVIVAKVINICRDTLFKKIIKNLLLFSHHNRTSYRIFAQEIIGKLLTEMTTYLEEPNETDLSIRLKVRKILIAIVLSRCADDSNMVRGKAMALISEIIDPNNNMDRVLIQDIFQIWNEENPLPSMEQLKQALESEDDPFPGSHTIVEMFIVRSEDERALVRRSALQILKNIIKLIPDILNKVIPIVGKHCRDPSLAVRRFAIHILSQLLQESYDNNILLNEWVQCVIPQIFDIEVKVQEKVLESMQELILDKICMFNVNNREHNSSNLPWKIVNKLVQEKMRNHLTKACTLWAQNGILTNALLSNIRSHIATNYNVEVWFLLAVISEFVELTNMDIYFLNYIELIRSEEFYSILILEVLRHSWRNLNRRILQRIYADLFQSLCQFKVNVECIGICMDILDGIIKYLQPNGDRILRTNMLTLMKSSEAKINKIFHEKENILDASPLRVMCTLGHASSLCTGNISSATLNTLQHMLLDWECAPAALKKMKEVLPFGIVLLGQQAMRDREIAQQVTPILGCLMCQATNPRSSVEAAIRVNAAKALADLCMRFTALVELYLPDMCICMKDPNPQVREAIIVIFIQLLLEEYIQVKGPFFLHILTMVSDSDENIRDLTIFLIKERLLIKNKTLIQQQFLRSIFHYNNCKSRHKFCDLKLSEKEKVALTLPGLKNQHKRHRIYDFMMEHLDPSGKLKLLIKLNSEVFGGICDGVLLMTKDNAKCVLKDALYIISSEFMQPSSWNNKQIDEDDILEDTPALPYNAINNIEEEIKKYRLEVLLPTLVKLKKKLVEVKSSLLEDVSKFFAKIMSDYNKEQLTCLFNEYPHLEKDIDDDIQKYNKKRQSRSNDRDEDEPMGISRFHPLLNTKVLTVSLERLPITRNTNLQELTKEVRSRTFGEKNIIDENNLSNSKHNWDITQDDTIPTVRLERFSAMKNSPLHGTEECENNGEEDSRTEESCLNKIPPAVNKNNLSPRISQVPKIMLRRLSTMTYPEISTTSSCTSSTSKCFISSGNRSSLMSASSKYYNSPSPKPGSSRSTSFEDKNVPRRILTFSPILMKHKIDQVDNTLKK